jgi:ATP-dependent 26S proteasome regulatory subunit
VASFDDILLFPPPTVDEIETLLCRHFHQLAVSSSVRLRTIAKSLEGFSHADVERVAHEAIKETILNERPQILPATLTAAVERQRQRRAITTAAQAAPAEEQLLPDSPRSTR